MSLQFEPPAPQPRSADPLPAGMVDDGATVTLRERPFLLWLCGAFMITFSLLMLLLRPLGMAVFVALLFSAIGLAMIVPVGVLVVTADRRTRVLTVERRGLVRPSRVQVRFADVRAVEVRTTRSSDSRGRSTPMYRTEIVLGEGAPVPLRTYWESGAADTRRRKAQVLAEVVGVGERAQ